MTPTQYIDSFFKMFAAFVVFGVLILLPYALLWTMSSGDMAVDTVVEQQSQNRFVIFGSGMSQDFVDYKLRLYAAKKPTIIALGSSRVMQFRERYFTKPFTNIGGTAGNLAVLRSTIDAMLAMHKPEAIILGLDFWWFTKTWHPDPRKPEPPTSGSYNYGFNTLKTPWLWLLDGKITPKEFFAPLVGGFRKARFGIMAQRFNDGFASDGSWYYTADVTGSQHPFDYQFKDTLTQINYGIKAFTPAPELSQEHINVLAEILCSLRAQHINVFVFIAPLSQRVYNTMYAKRAAYPQLFHLKDQLRERGIDVVDVSNPRTFGATDCEFIDGFHGGDVAYARVLQSMSDHFPSLRPYVTIEKLQQDIEQWEGNAMMPDARVTALPEVDFMHFQCTKKRQ